MWKLMVMTVSRFGTELHVLSPRSRTAGCCGRGEQSLSSIRCRVRIWCSQSCCGVLMAEVKYFLVLFVKKKKPTKKV